MEELITYLQDNKIDFEQVSKNVVEIDSKTYQLIKPDEDGHLFDETMEMTCEDTVEDNYVFCFGDIWYWTPKGSEVKPQFNKLKYIGQAKLEFDPIPWLGVRGKYEILNGSRSYEDWCKKASFLGCDTLGICEKNTLAGTLQFQEECKKNNIKPIIGATYTVFNQDKDIKYDIKVYAKNYDGWQTILSINKTVLVDNNKFISEQQLKSLETSNIYVIVDPKSLDFEDINIEFDFYQYDSVKYKNYQTDVNYLNNLKKYILSDYEPILIQDSLYLDREDSYIKRTLNSISGVRELTSENQYFKSLDDIFDEFDELFDPEDDKFEFLIERSVKNLNKVVDSCEFEVETGTRHLPKYRMTLEEKSKFKDNRELFDYLIEEGFKDKVPKGKEEEYRERLEKEIEVIEYGDVIDYFLILWDIIKWSHNNDILVGIGRGSAGGALTSYLLDIIKLDPLQYNLLFERFLTKARVETGLPDIDTDFEGIRRNEVKRYMEEKYGENQVCSVGTYTTLKMRAAFNDLCKLDGADIGEIRYMSKMIEDDVQPCDIFQYSCDKPQLKNFINEHSLAINQIPLVFKQPRSSSIHACATLVLPKEKTVFEFCPVKKMKLNDGEDVLVTEWEGGELEKAGFLKEDILGILQLDKFASILSMINDNRGENVNIYNIDKFDLGTFRYFQNGWNEDVFQFGTQGLKAYCKLAKPESIEDLSAINALYRPGAMNSNAHMEYVDIKNGDKDPEYDYMLESVTKDTFGLYIYQEQSMLASQVLSGFSPEDADILRKVILTKGKKGLIHKKEEYREKFISGGVKNGCAEEEAEKIWNKLEQFAAYGFNKSHSVAYAITGYISQYLKVHYPIEFWITAFTFVPEGKKDVKIPAYISEIHQTGDIQLKPVDINKSGNGFSGDFDNNSIYWSLNSVKQCGDKAVEQLVKDKKEKGEYFDFKEFLSRNVHKGSKVTKQVIEHLIICGAFDEIENIHQSKDRLDLIELYRKEYKIKIANKETDILLNNKDSLQFNWWWNMMQKRLSGFALFDYRLLCDNFLDCTNRYENVLSEADGEYIKTGGYINEIVARSNKKGEYADVILDNNFEFIQVKFWYDQWKQVKPIIDQKEKCLLLISGKVQFDKWRGHHVIVANDNSDILILE